jgi:hypothetical protein
VTTCRLHLEDAAGDREVQLLAARQGHDHLARLEAGDQRRVLRRDAQLAEFAGGHDQFGLAVEDLGLGADDVATDGGCHGTLFPFMGRRGGLPLRGYAASFLAFSTASSIEPTM